MSDIDRSSVRISTIEHLSFNAQPSFSTIHYDGWILRIADGYTRRANSVNPIYYSNLPVDQKIEWCEKIYKQLSLKVAFKMTEQVYPFQLDQILSDRGYSVNAVTSVQLCSLDNLNLSVTPGITMQAELDHNFLEHYVKLNGINSAKLPLVKKMHKLIQFPKIYAYQILNDEVIACGLGVGERDYLGIFGVAVKPEFRGYGWGKKVMNSLLFWGKNQDLKYSYLQVFADNVPAVNLYKKLNYVEQYQYWYRTKSV